MSPAETIVFNPSIPDRELDREASKVDKRLAESGQIQPEIGDVEGDLGLGDLGGDGGGFGGGMGGLGAGSAGGIAGLASKIPKPVAGVTAAAALPVALAGGIGVSMLGAMQDASARLQTQGKLLGIAVDNFFREPGNILAERIKPITNAILDLSFGFDESLREIDSLLPGAPGEIKTGLALADAVGNALEESVPMFEWPDIKGLWPGWPAIADKWPGWPDIDTEWPGWPSIQRDWPGWPDIRGAWDGWPDVSAEWPGWPDVNGLWPGWPDIDGLWPGWPNIGKLWPGWPAIIEEWQGYPDILADWDGWPDINTPSWPSADDILDEFPSISPSDLRDEIMGNDEEEQELELADPPEEEDNDDDVIGGHGPGGGDDGGGGKPEKKKVSPKGFVSGARSMAGFQRGGVINRPTPVMAGESGTEVITPIAELRRMMEGVAQQQSGGGGQAPEVDMSQVENKLDRLNRNITQLAQAMQSMSIEVDGETLGRVASDAQREQVTDTDPLIR